MGRNNNNDNEPFNIKELLANQQLCEYHMTLSVSGNYHMVLGR